MKQTGKNSNRETLWPWREVLFVFSALFLIEFLFMLGQNIFLPIIQNITGETKWDISILIYVLLTRIVDTLFIIYYSIKLKRKGWLSLGISKEECYKNIRRGLIVCLIFGAVVFLAAGIYYILFSVDILKIAFGTNVNPILHNRLYLSCYISVVVIAAPFVEEIVFRGILYPPLRMKSNAPVAILINAAIFAAFHGITSSFFFIQLTGGIVFASLYEKSGSVIPGYIVHSLGNLAIFSVGYFYLN